MRRHVEAGGSISVGAANALLMAAKIDPGETNQGWVTLHRHPWVISAPPLTRLSGKLWMRPIYEDGGWQSGMALFRVEARFQRGILRDLGAAHARSATKTERWFDDPWQALQHLQDL